jgi:hypothetical protein
MVDGGGVCEDLFLVVTGTRDGVLSTSVGKTTEGIKPPDI